MSSIDAVLPLVPRDIPRFEILARSLARYFAPLGTLYAVLPDAAMAQARPALQRLGRGLPLRVVAESEWAPDLERFFQLRGWYKQQLLKLAAAEFVASPYYLTLDADVVCTRACRASDLLPGGRSPCYVIPRDDHPDWYRGAANVLGVSPRRTGILHNVTPVLWARAGVAELIDHLERRASARKYLGGLAGLRHAALFALYRRGMPQKSPAWRAWLAASTPWAEYALYFTYLEAVGRFEEYHFDSPTCLYDVDRSLWRNTKSVDGWDPSPLFTGEGPPYFAVLQSNTGIAAADFLQKLAPFLD